MANSMTRPGAFLALGLFCFGSQAAAVQDAPKATESHKAVPTQPKAKTHSNKQRGRASIYSRKLARKPMANGAPLDLDSNAAASKHLPLGSRARVTNLRNGKSAEVEIKDRGPYVKGRIIDLSPKTAAELGFHSGTAPVEVVPIGGKDKAQAQSKLADDASGKAPSR